MLDRIRERVGSAGLVVAVIALMLAVAGGAYAAGGGLSSKQKKEVEKISKKFAGKPGAPGAAGANGKDGANGANGKDGTNGTVGADGKSITARAALPAECGERGGAIVEDEAVPPSEIEVCAGEEGSPWTANGALPVGATETGSWIFSANESSEKEVYAPLSFAVPLSAGLTAEKVHFQSEANFEDFDGAGGEEIGCKGTNAIPMAPEGNLCVYGLANVSGATFVAITNLGRGASGGNRSGALLVFEREPTGPAIGSGSFAVTGFPSP